LKAAGNAFFSEGKAAEALAAYTEALLIDPLNVEYNSVLYSNRAAASVKLRQWQAAVDDCTRCLEGKPAFTKAKLRRAQCYLELKQFDTCIVDYEALLRDDRENAELAKALKHAKLELKKSKRKDYYSILGVSQSATETEIKKAYRKKALEWHPVSGLNTAMDSGALNTLWSLTVHFSSLFAHFPTPGQEQQHS
jgi:DnaJ family protein C protein 7